MPERTRVYHTDELGDILVDSGWTDAGDVEVLVVALGDGTAPHDLVERLALLPVPLIGIGAGERSPLSDVMDVVVAGEDELDAVLASVRANPRAAAVLVQVLRSVGRLPVVDALALESLGYATLQGGPEFARWLEGRSRAPSKPPPAGEAVLLERDGAVLQIVLNAPHNRNALSVAMRDGLTDAFRLVAMDPGIRRVDVRGNGPCFSSGGDLTEFGTADDVSLAHQIRMRRMPARYLAPRAERYRVHVHGACVGAGIELSAFAAHVTATADAFFQLPELAMGLIPGAGGCVSIPRRIGRQRTALMALTNRRVDAGQALSWGLVDAVVA